MAGGKGEPVTLPHTWNAADGQDGGNDYYRGTCWYMRDLNAPILENGERMWLEIRGAAMTAEVWLNDVKLAHHKGGYSTFRVDLTDHLCDNNILAISVDNSDNDNVYPQNADFTFYGGLYRDVNLIIVPAVHFSLGYCGGSGIKVTPMVDLDANSAEVTVEAWTVGGADTVTFTLDNQQQAVPVADGHAAAVFTISNVHLWDGVDDPYLYTVFAKLDSGDTVSTRFGCRSFQIDPQKGFFLNGRSYPLYGVSRHQDWADIGNALTMEHHRKDMDIIRELGANTIRLAHYQHDQAFYDLCDENGIVVWAEIPYISMNMENGRENTLSQMEELIIQNYNHPCVAVWGLSNEISIIGGITPDVLENHQMLNDLCHRLDPTRLTTMASENSLDTDSPLLEIPDVNSYNLYFGWYTGETKQTGEFLDAYHAEFPNRPIGLSEYGADANPQFQSAQPQRGDYTEGYQALYHEQLWQLIEVRPWLWATHIWNLFDFGADGRNEGGKHGQNQKGLVTFDRAIKKDAFYLYKAAWNKTEPFVHLCGRRYADRAEDMTEIKVYSNQPEVTLYVDGRPVGKQTGRTIFTFTVPITGKHSVKACADNCNDTMEIQKVSEPNQSYIYDKMENVANWFEQDSYDPACYSICDTMTALWANSQSAEVINGMLEKMMPASEDSSGQSLDELQKLVGRLTLQNFLNYAGDAITKDQIQQINHILQTIKKTE